MHFLWISEPIWEQKLTYFEFKKATERKLATFDFEHTSHAKCRFLRSGPPPGEQKMHLKTASEFMSILGVILGASGVDFDAFWDPKMVKKWNKNPLEFSDRKSNEKEQEKRSQETCLSK